jgi:hypothetical protein
LALALLPAPGCSGDAPDDSGGPSGATGGPPPTSEPTTGPTTEPTPGSTGAAPGEPPPDAARLGAARSSPVDDPYYPEQGEPYLDALHYDLALDWSAPARRLTGTTTITFEVTDQRSEVQLDLAAQLRVTGATLDGAEVSSRAGADQSSARS